MALINISHWPPAHQRWVPIGKRIKNVLYNPETFEMYYFKEPKEKYPWEFWIEIIAYKIGLELGFDVLEYQPAQLDGIGGCLSKSMTDNFTQELIHGQQFMIRMYPEFEIKKGTDHTFQLVEEFFKSDERYFEFFEDFIEMLVFDAVIGNRDRHQQNWAIIRNVTVIKKRTNFFGKERRLSSPLISVTVEFSKIFDNGNCLGYNILEENLGDFVDDEVELDKYLFGKKAVSHLRWFGSLFNHVELLEKIHQKYPQRINETISRIRNVYDKDKLFRIVKTIDKDVTFANPIYNLSDKRKEFICKLIEKRIDALLVKFK